MQQDFFFAVAVGVGFLLIALVCYSYLRPRPEHRPALTALLGLLGFALVASPNWTRISIRSDGLELSLLREIESRQLRALGELQDLLEERATVPEEAGSAPAEPDEPPVPPEIAPEERPNLEERTERALAERSRQHGESLLAAYERGELDLRTLSDAELLVLNEQVTRHSRSAPRPQPRP